MDNINLDLLKEVLHLLTTVDRDLEPWVEDTICDNFITTTELTDTIEQFFTYSHQSERFKLKVMAQVLSSNFAKDIQNKLVARLLDKLSEVLENNAADSLQLFTSTSVYHPVLRGPQSLWVSGANTKHAAILHNKAIQYLFSSNLNIFESAVKVLSEACSMDAKYFDQIPSQFKPNVLSALPDQIKAATLFQQEYNKGDIVEICKVFTDKQLKLVAPVIVNSFEFDELEHIHDKICSKELYHTHSHLVRTMLFCLGDKLGLESLLKNVTFFSDEKSLKSGVLADCIEVLVKYKTASEKEIKEDKHQNQSPESCQDYSSDRNYQECDCDIPLSPESNPIYSNLKYKNQSKYPEPTAFTSSIITALFKNQLSDAKNFIIETLINDCTTEKQMKNCLRLLNTLIGLKALRLLMTSRPGECHHPTNCVPKNKCLLLSMITFMTENNSQKYALCIDFFTWVCTNSDLGKIEEEEDRIIWEEENFDDSENSYESFCRSRSLMKRDVGIVFDFKTLVEKKVRYRDFIEPTLELFLGVSQCRETYYSGVPTTFTCSPKLTKSVEKVVAVSALETFCNKDDCDMYTRVSILDFFRKSHLWPLLSNSGPQYLLECFYIVSKMLTALRLDDSTVAIAFFKMIKSQAKFFEELLFHTHLSATDVGALTGPAIRSSSNTSVQDAGNTDNPTRKTIENVPIPPADLDEIISTIVDTNEAEDAALIQARCAQEEHTNIVAVNKEEILIALLECIVEDRCDVERLEAGGSLLLMMLSMRQQQSEQYFEFLVHHDYFDLLTGEQSPILNDIKKGLSKSFNSVGKDNDSFQMFVKSIRTTDMKKKKFRVEEDLKTVIALLKAEPDPDLVCDCY